MAIDIWVKAEKKDAELQNIIAEQKLRTQIILGELIAEGQRNGIIASAGNTTGNNQYESGNIPKGNNSKSIEAVSLSHKQSSAFQQIASIPEKSQAVQGKIIE